MDGNIDNTLLVNSFKVLVNYFNGKHTDTHITVTTATYLYDVIATIF